MVNLDGHVLDLGVFGWGCLARATPALSHRGGGLDSAGEKERGLLWNKCLHVHK
jgi:hypothetical protein